MIGLAHRLLRLLTGRPAPAVAHLRAQVATVRAREDAEGEALDPVDNWRPEYLPAPEQDRWCPRCRFASCSPRCGRCGAGTWARQVPAEHVPSPRKPLREGRL